VTWRRVIGILLVAAAAAGAVWLLRPNDRRAIEKRTRELAGRMEKRGPEGALAAAAAARGMADYFTLDARFSADFLPYSAEGRDELVSAVFQVRTALDSLEIDLHGMETDVDGDRASMNLAARASARGRGQRDSLWREFDVEWVRTGEGWKISEARAVEPIRRPRF
jgi:hypothetical protein